MVGVEEMGGPAQHEFMRDGAIRLHPFAPDIVNAAMGPAMFSPPSLVAIQAAMFSVWKVKGGPAHMI